MKWNQHYGIKSGDHAFLGASKYHWLNYDDQKLAESFISYNAKQRGTRLHAWAAETIKLGIKQRKSNQTLPRYINDAIGFKMDPEVVLYYSDNCFGTADAISFRDGLLRIHDLKTGIVPAKMEQLIIYAALFCLEYDVKPGTIHFELRIYQNDNVQIFEPEADDILPVMDRIKHCDQIINKLKMEG